ncbi:MAG TPA: ribosomal protein L7/L12 [Planctomycetaceae bacterium]
MPVCRFCDHDAPAGAKNCPACGAELPDVSERADAPDLETELLGLIDRGELLAAVKRYREATGAGLKEAKDAIDALQATRRLDADLRPRPGGTDSALEDELLDLLSRGDKIAAIKVYRKRTGAGLKEAKDAVEALAARRGLAVKGSGCLGAVLFLLAVAGSLAAAV